MKDKKTVVTKVPTSIKVPLIEFMEYKQACQQINYLQKMVYPNNHKRFSAQQRIIDFIVKDLPRVQKILEQIKKKGDLQ
jgi:hypothetical protein